MGIEIRYLVRPGCSPDIKPNEPSQLSLHGYGKYETKRKHRRHVGRCEDNIKKYRKESVCKPMDGIILAQDRVWSL